MKKNIYILACLLLLAACRKKELPVADPEDPHFRLSCSVDGAPLLLEAGNNGYYMNSGYFYDTSGVYVLKAHLAPECAQPCGYALTVHVYDAVSSVNGAPIQADSALRVGEYFFNERLVKPVYTKSMFTPVEEEVPGNSYTWLVRDEAGNLTEVKSYTLAQTLLTGKSYTISLISEDNVGCSTEHRKIFTAGDPLHGNISAVRTSSTALSYKFEAHITSQDLSYSWEFGDGSTSQLASPVHTFLPKAGYYNTRLRITNSNGDAVEMNYQVPGSLDKTCLANFDCALTPVPNLRPYSKVVVMLTRPDGRTFSSSGFDQPSGSNFRITATEEYMPNASNDRTRRVHATFNCLLRNGTEEIRLTDAAATLAFGYK